MSRAQAGSQEHSFGSGSGFWAGEVGAPLRGRSYDRKEVRLP